MPGFFEAFSNFSSRENTKKHTVKIQNMQIEVSLDKKIEIMKAGEQMFMVEDGEVVLRPLTKTRRKFAILRKNTKGYHFYNGDPHWVENLGEEGYTWQIESE